MGFSKGKLYECKSNSRKKKLRNTLIYHFRNPINRYPFLLHIVTVTDGYGTVFFGLVIDRHAERGTDGVHTPVSLTDRVFFLVEAAEMRLAAIHDLPGDLRQ